MENISRLACDTLEDNRLASYTEKSSRYQVIDPESFHIPSELDNLPALRAEYVSVCRALFAAYAQLIDGVMSHLRSRQPQRDGERDSAYDLRLRRQATDACRAVLPASTLTNVGVTANARTLEHAISKLMSSDLAEERDVGSELREQGRSITPTLVKYADHSAYLAGHRQVLAPADEAAPDTSPISVRLLDFDRDATRKLAAALLFRRGGDYGHALAVSEAMTEVQRIELIDGAVRNIGPHDAAPREFELAGYTFEFVFDYGAMREFRRHRMQTYLGQPLTVANGCDTPPLVKESGLTGVFEPAVSQSERLYSALADEHPALAQYAVTHAHRQRVLSRMNLRECYHLFKLRSSREAHRSIREPILEAMRLAVAAQPELFRRLPLRNAPVWWPFAQR